MAAPESLVLEEEIDQDYEPTQEEIVEYATWLGMVRCTRTAQSLVAQEVRDLTDTLRDGVCLLVGNRTWRPTRSSSGWRERA